MSIIIGNNDYEHTIIGLLVMADEALAMPQLVNEITSQLDSSEFRQIQAQRCYQVVIDLIAQKTQITLITVLNSVLPEDRQYVTTCATMTHLTNIMSAQHFIDVIKDYSTRRNIGNAATSVIQDIANTQVSTGELLDRVKSLDMPDDRNDLFNMGSMLDDLYKTIEENAKTGKTTGISYHLPSITRLTAGKKPGQYIIVGGRPGDGKSSFLLGDAMHSASQGKTALYCTLEITAEQVTRNALCQASGITVNDMEAGQFDRPKWSRLHKAGESIYKRPPIIYDKSGMSVTDIERKIAQLSPQVVYIDYLQLMRDNEYGKYGRYQEISYISTRIKELAKAYNVPIVCAAQLNRDSVGNSRPRAYHLKESGSLEQDADVIILLHNKGDENNENHFIRTPTNVILEKNREGQTGFIASVFNKPRLRFEEVERR